MKNDEPLALEDEPTQPMTPRPKSAPVRPELTWSPRLKAGVAYSQSFSPPGKAAGWADRAQWEMLRSGSEVLGDVEIRGSSFEAFDAAARSGGWVMHLGTYGLQAIIDCE